MLLMAIEIVRQISNGNEKQKKKDSFVTALMGVLSSSQCCFCELGCVEGSTNSTTARTAKEAQKSLFLPFENRRRLLENLLWRTTCSTGVNRVTTSGVEPSVTKILRKVG